MRLLQETSTIVLATALVAVAGCGSSDRDTEEDAVRAVIERYVTALGKGDGRTACAALTPAAKRGLIRGARSAVEDPEERRLVTCEAYVQATRPFYVGQRRRIDRIQVTGDRARGRVSLSSSNEDRVTLRKDYTLRKIDARWYIASQTD